MIVRVCFFLGYQVAFLVMCLVGGFGFGFYFVYFFWGSVCFLFWTAFLSGIVLWDWLTMNMSCMC